ncbi:MAG TPA: PAS-domain containing protein [Xanthobacteraceae bacterium]
MLGPAAAIVSALATLDRYEFAALALSFGALLFAVLAASALVRTRARAAAAEVAHRRHIRLLNEAVDRANALLSSEPQALVVWPAATDEPEIIGEVGLVAPEHAPHRVLTFGAWLEPEAARALDSAVAALRSRGEGFALSLTTLHGRHIDAEGRAVVGRAMLRLREVSGVKLQLAELSAEHRRLQHEVEAQRALVEALPSPVWVRDAVGRLLYVNAAYARAVDAGDAGHALASGVDLLDGGAREELAFRARGGAPQARRLTAVVAGRRRVLDVLAVPTAHGSAAIGIDVTEVETLRGELARMIEAHRRTLDQLATAVAVYDTERRLTFYNAAYRTLWDLDPAFLDQAPSDMAVLDALRAARKLPEQQDFRQWRTQVHEAYQAAEARAHEWHLPDGRTLRVVTTPNPEGGVTYLFDDVTERLDLERRFDALIRVQGETLDNLGEAVAVFGSDGRLRLSNPTFAQMWRLDPQGLADRPHVETVIAWCRTLDGNDEDWRRLRTAVTALDLRAPLALRMERVDGAIVDCATVPLPDGGTLVTFIDVTASVNVERALRERNEALMAADQLKEAFLHHMSYELRSPLTNIIGFAHFLGDSATGPLNERQREYLGYITSSTNALMAIVDNILDLATIEAGAMTLDLGAVDIRGTMEAAAEGVQDRLLKDDIRLDLRTSPNIGTFIADERRVRQILFNLLSNAIGFSPKGGVVTLAAERQPDAIVVSVSDQGPGIPPDMVDRVFGWFESDPLGSRHRGVGLGLSLVRSFVKLHGGTVHIDSAVGRGTTVSCIFPHERVGTRSAAE